MIRKTKKLDIYIDREDICLGEPDDIENCAIAHSLKRLFPKSNISVDGDGDVIIGKFEYQTCKIGKDFINKFDIDKTKCNPCYITLTRV